MSKAVIKLNTVDLSSLANGIPVDPLPLAANNQRDLSVPHAPKRTPELDSSEFKLAVKNALRYFPSRLHALLAREFAHELREFGHIYMYRFRPINYAMKAYPLTFYEPIISSVYARCIAAQIMNNLDPSVAQFPHELITYGGNGSVFSNWAQYHLVMKYLCLLNDHQTLVLCSGHPSGLFPSPKKSPKLIITNGMMIPNYSNKCMYEKQSAMGVTQYGQMTAGSFCYIGPQGIVHGTTITVMNAGRLYLKKPSLENTGVVYLSSGLGGMSGAQGKAAMICGCIAVICEVDKRALMKRYDQGWLDEIHSDLDIMFDRVCQAKKNKLSVAIGFHGNCVDVWEFFARKTAEWKQQCEDLGREFTPIVELGSDQTSLHNPFGGGYYPSGMTFDESQIMMSENPSLFKDKVYESLRRQVSAINKLCEMGTHFWDYGNCFLLESSRAGADVLADEQHSNELRKNDRKKGNNNNNVPNLAELSPFRYQSYVQSIMGDIFSLGFGPFRWVCMSQNESDLRKCDELAEKVLSTMLECEEEPRVIAQLKDNRYWIRRAFENKLVVGSQARILYANAEGRIKIAKAFNDAIRKGEVRGPIVLSRDHHDVSGTDSPFRETSDVYDGSRFCADMSVQNAIGDSFRGATWVALHNGGGVGWGEVMNGGFGLVLDGSDQANENARDMLFWDVNNGIARRAWAGNDHARFAIERAMKENPDLKVTLAQSVQNESLLDQVCDNDDDNGNGQMKGVSAWSIQSKL